MFDTGCCESWPSLNPESAPRKTEGLSAKTRECASTSAETAHGFDDLEHGRNFLSRALIRKVSGHKIVDFKNDFAVAPGCACLRGQFCVCLYKQKPISIETASARVCGSQIRGQVEVSVNYSSHQQATFTQTAFLPPKKRLELPGGQAGRQAGRPVQGEIARIGVFFRIL